MKSKKRTAIELCALAILAVAALWALQAGGSKGEKSDLRASLKNLENTPLPVAGNTATQQTQSNTSTETEQKVTRYNPDKAFHGFTLRPRSGGAKIQLVNMTGNIVHEWNMDAARARILPNCNMLVVHGSKWGLKQSPWKRLRKYIREYDWEGNIVWEVTAPGPTHHDVRRLSNGNTAFLYRMEVPREYLLKSKDPKKHNAKIRSDAIVEVNPEGEIVWEWKAYEHLSVDDCGAKPCGEVSSDQAKGKSGIDWTHTNVVYPLPENKWYDAGDKRFKPGNYLIHVRNFWTSMIIDRDTKKIVWKYSGDYKGGLEAGHEAYMIPKGLPGDGNILVLDNGRKREQSFVLEINPTTKKPVWVFDIGDQFFTDVAGAAQRLPNGNTLISEDVPGRAFEVTPEKEIVWEYRGDRIRTCRATRYTQDHCEKLKQFPLY